MLRRHRKCVFHDVSVCLRRTRGDSAVKISLKTREPFWNPLVPRRLVLIRLQRAAMFRTARSDAIAPSSKLDDWGQQVCLRRCKNASIMMLCRATNVARATGRRTFADGPLLKTMLYDLHVCSQRTAKDPRPPARPVAIRTAHWLRDAVTAPMRNRPCTDGTGLHTRAATPSPCRRIKDTHARRSSAAARWCRSPATSCPCSTRAPAF